MTDYTLRAVPSCPACGGRWLNSWRWQHLAGPKDCKLRTAEDATQAADSYRLRLTGRTYRRPVTDAERALWRLVAGQDLHANAVTVVYADFASGIWPRAIAGVPSAADVAAQAA
ncbi:hypothetical protein RF638_04365 [Kocuria sp. CPCC 205235]|uniref:hypothetical protein n=1 Tax=Kocuria sp. CPCC 205235 TaxID=3073549 RepID=UPI0034D56789